MTKGRRAADRRREREGSRVLADDGATDPARAAADSATKTGLAPGLLDDPELEFRAALSGDAALADVAEVTAVAERPGAPPRRGGRLVVRKGPGAGAVHPLSYTPTLCGRGAKAQVKLEDPAVSRAHLCLRFLAEDGAWVVEDAGSRSGTLLNGVLVEGPCEIKHGDLLHLGQSELRFVWDEALPEPLPEEPAEPDEPEEKTATGTRPAMGPLDEQTLAIRRAPGREPRGEAPQKGRSSVLVAALVGAALLVLTGAGVGSYFAFFHQKSDARQIRLQVEALLSDARRLLSELKLEEAKARLDTVLALSPGEPDAESLMRLVVSEMASRAALEEARALFEAGKHEEALQVLKRIPDTSGFAHERDRLRADISEKERLTSLREVERLLDEGRTDEALALLEKHLSRWPTDEAARALRLRIEEKQGAPASDHPAVAAAKRAFAQGNLGKARVLVESEAGRGTRAAQRYLADLDTFEAALGKGERHLAVMDARVARPELERAFGLLSRLGGRGSSTMQRRVGRPFANALYLDAMAKQRRGDDCGWAADVLRAHELNGADAKVKAQKRAVDSKAKEGLLRARAAASSDPARGKQIAREHLCFAPRSSGTGKALRKVLR